MLYHTWATFNFWRSTFFFVNKMFLKNSKPLETRKCYLSDSFIYSKKKKKKKRIPIFTSIYKGVKMSLFLCVVSLIVKFSLTRWFCRWKCYLFLFKEAADQKTLNISLFLGSSHVRILFLAAPYFLAIFNSFAPDSTLVIALYLFRKR